MNQAYFDYSFDETAIIAYIDLYVSIIISYVANAHAIMTIVPSISFEDQILYINHSALIIRYMSGKISVL